MAEDKMPKDVEMRIRALPGNDKCVDCNNITPQWASVSYGSLVCLECSGQHRALGVHLSFVRSVAMDSWKPRQIEAMEKSGGNAKIIEYFESRGIKKNLPIATKYNTKQAGYLRERLTRWLDGRREPPPDPGRYDPTTGVSEAQGAEPLPGETTEEYNARQARLREAARERLRAKFGNSGIGGQMTGLGSPEPAPNTDGIGGLLGGIGSFVKNNVIDNENVRGVVRGVGGAAGGAISSIRGAVEERGGISGIVGGVKDTLAGSGGGGYGGGGFGGNTPVSEPTGGGTKTLDDDDEAFFASIGQKKGSGNGGYGGSTNGSSNGTATKAQPKRGGFNDDDWGEDAVADITKSVGNMSTGGATNGSANQNSINRTKSAPAPAAATAPAPASGVTRAASANSGTGAGIGAPTPKAKSKLEEPEDFFAQFGV